jgi:Transposase IS66 family
MLSQGDLSHRVERYTANCESESDRMHKVSFSRDPAWRSFTVQPVPPCSRKLRIACHLYWQGRAASASKTSRCGRRWVGPRAHVGFEAPVSRPCRTAASTGGTASRRTRSSRKPPPARPTLPGRPAGGRVQRLQRTVRSCAPSGTDHRRILRSSSVAGPIDYMLRRWDRFTRFINDGRICLTNNAAERSRGCSPAPNAAPTDRAAVMTTLITTQR